MLTISQELGDAAEALHGAAVVEHQLQGRAPDEITGGWGHPAPPGPRDQRGHGGSRHRGARGTGPHGEAVEVTHTWEDMEARLGRLILAAAALDDLTGATWDTVDERLRFCVAWVAASDMNLG
ncbi:hypothetical protein ACOT81_06620 [Streptomyces sp. WI04-05B]|uniref:hypothetical protein n=1 Tax=Streptomyces TaxID=1883 RepID=UPI00224EA597|nr:MULTISPECIES: hypothetical protein [unclassified Streptomyces]MCX5264436.1 hypothetical protein [Streptomyces sp. NBC_00199]MDX2544991.1 hypothetical protein [Streptomyces sp. WI04-05B]MDX2587482.1 hypothetical protein [Streptomyces sp. WI04-05A]